MLCGGDCMAHSDQTDHNKNPHLEETPDHRVQGWGYYNVYCLHCCE